MPRQEAETTATKIHSRNRLYDILLPYINRSFRQSYRNVEYTGISDIPQDGAIIFAPNHANTLMDALAVLSLDNRPKLFVARADIFKIKVVAPILRFLKMLPINRIRDGKDALAANADIMRQCVEALSDGVPFCILPEGTHRTMHSLLPLKKGIARIALEAIRNIPQEIPVRIVPVGLEYEDYFEFRSRLLVSVASPIDVRDFCTLHEGEEDAVLMRSLLKELEQRIKESIIYLPDDERYKGLWEASNIFWSREKGHSTSQFERRVGIQRIVERLSKRNPGIIKSAEEFSERREARRIRLSSITSGPTVPGMVLRGALLLALAPLAIAETIILSPALLTIAFIKKNLKDKAFVNSIRFVTCFLLYRILLILVSIPIIILFPLWGATAFFAGWFSPFIFYDYTREIKQLFSDIYYRRYEKSINQNF